MQMRGNLIGGFNYIIKPINDEFVAYAKEGEFVCDGHFVNEPGTLHFEFGPTAQAAHASLLADIKRLMQ